MSEYSDFPKDFLVRTQSNLYNYSGYYEVTNLINNCLGLIIIPKELLIDNLPDYKFIHDETKFGISKQNINLEINNDFSLANVVRHIRNGISHGRIEQRSDNEIKGVRIYDKYNNEAEENFSIELTVDELKDFAIKVSNEFIN